MKIHKYEVYNLEQALRAAGYPKQTEFDFTSSIKDGDYKRAVILGNADNSSGHDCYLKGILVVADITYTQYWSMQFQRYHFSDIVSSSSKMHKITSMDFSKCCNSYVLQEVVDIMNNLKDSYNAFSDLHGLNPGYNIRGEPLIDLSIGERKVGEVTKNELFQFIMANCPMGLELTMEIVTNYLQLKTMYKQRYSTDAVKLPDDWGVFCNWIKSLPYFTELCLSKPSDADSIVEYIKAKKIKSASMKATLQDI